MCIRDRLGPHGLGAIQSTDAINLLSDLGLAFLFLLAGYEISPKSLTGTEGKRGAATWAVTFAIAFVVVAIWPTLSALSLIHIYRRDQGCRHLDL